MSEERIRRWLTRNAPIFGASLLHLEPQEAGRRIAERYEIDVSGLTTQQEWVDHIANELEARNG